MSGLTPEELAELEGLSERLKRGTYFEVFQLAEDDESDALRGAYYDLSRRFHPDRFFRRDLDGREEQVEEVFAGLNEAYRVLKDPDERKRYLRTLDQARPRRRSRASNRPRSQPAQRASGKAPVAEAPEPDSHTVSWSPKGGGDGKAGAKAAQPAKERVRKRRRRKKTKQVPPAVAKLKAQVMERLKKARRYYKQGLSEVEEEAWTKAASSFYLAMKSDPRNEEYRQQFQEANRRSRALQAARSMDMGRKAESFRNVKEALSHYEEAARCDPEAGEPWYRLARLRLNSEQDTRGALNDFRRAVDKEPNNAEFRMSLAQTYEELEMRLNAHREYKAVLGLKPKHEEAKAGARRTR